MTDTEQKRIEIPPTLILAGEINIQNSTELIKCLLEIDAVSCATNNFEPIDLFINSSGGDLYSSFAICDVLSMIKTPVRTIGLGQVASGAFMIFMSGKQGLRIATTNTQFMSHRYAIGYEATHANIKSQQPELDRVHDRIIDLYKKNTGLSKKVIDKDLLTEHDVWLTAEDCKTYNICDQVLDMSKIGKKVRKYEKPIKKSIKHPNRK